MARKARIVTINDKPYRFTKSEMELIESHGITAGMVSKRVKDGWEPVSYTHLRAHET